MHKLKYATAVLTAVYDLSSSELEDITGIRRGLISKWKTERSFSDKVSQIQDDFIIALNEILNDPLDECLVADALYWSATLKRLVVYLCREAVKCGDSAQLLRLWPIVNGILTTY